VRKLSGLLLLMLVTLSLAACGSDDGNDEPTAVATEVADETPTVTPTESALGIDEATPASVTPTLTDVGTPVVTASPVVAATPVPAVTPVVLSSPVADASPVAATPAAALVVPVGDVASPEPTAVRMVALAGQVILPGSENQAFVISDEGCVGLGANADMQAGRQLVVRNENGTIIGVTTLTPAEAAEGCAWDFALEVPESQFYSVAIPMKTEMIFTHDEIEQSGSEVAIPLP
jgi:hypothetical protein